MTGNKEALMTFIFGESFQKALNTYSCDRCGDSIGPGETYRRWLWKVDLRRVHVMREHEHCDPEDPSEYEEEADLFECTGLPLAA